MSLRGSELDHLMQGQGQWYQWHLKNGRRGQATPEEAFAAMWRGWPGLGEAGRSRDLLPKSVTVFLSADCNLIGSVLLEHKGRALFLSGLLDPPSFHSNCFIRVLPPSPRGPGCAQRVGRCLGRPPALEMAETWPLAVTAPPGLRSPLSCWASPEADIPAGAPVEGGALRCNLNRTCDPAPHFPARAAACAVLFSVPESPSFSLLIPFIMCHPLPRFEAG